MLYLVHQNKQRARKHIAILQIMASYVKKLNFCYICEGYRISHKPFGIHPYLYFHKIFKRIVRTGQNLSAEAWNNSQSASFKISKMA